MDGVRSMQVDAAVFDALVEAALDRLPQAIAEQVRNVVVLVEDEPPPGEGSLLGLYDGVPLTERGANEGFLLPDRIYLFRGPLSRMCASEEELRDEIEVTVVHEVAHHFGIEDDQLHAWGYG